MLSNLSSSELADIYRKSDIVLGQLSKHRRLSYTIPHKAFEAGYFAKPYITTDSPGVREIYGQESVILLENISGVSIANEIIKLADPEKRSRLQSSIGKRYRDVASQEVLNLRFESFLQKL
jgi:glycosyltransferase involved in cell wall biosynthesis